MAGYVYVVENENHKVKIGMTVDPDRRIATLETQGGYKIISRYVTPSLKYYSRLESDLHRKFSDCRDIGEWFNIDFNTVVDYVESMDLSLYVFEEDNDDEDSETFQHAFIKVFMMMKRRIPVLNETIDILVSLWSNDVDILLNRIEVLEDKLTAYEDAGCHVDYPKKDIESDSQKKMAEMFERHAKLFG